MYINEKTFEVITSGIIPKGIDWIKIPKEAEECYYFDGSDPDVAEDLLFYTKDLEATWTGEYWSDNTKCIYPTYHSIKKYVKENGRLIWCKEQLMNNEEIKTVKYLNRKTHDVFESSEDYDNEDYLLLPNDVETIVVDSEDIILFKVGYSCCVFENCIFSGWGFDEYGLEHYLEKYPSLKVIWSKGKSKDTITTDSGTSVFNPLVPQEGGDHYKLRSIQPIEYSERNGLSMCQGNIVKYITRHKEKNRVGDLAKVVHYALLEAYFVYGESGSTELKDKILKLLWVSNNG